MSTTAMEKVESLCATTELCFGGESYPDGSGGARLGDAASRAAIMQQAVAHCGRSTKVLFVCSTGASKSGRGWDRYPQEEENTDERNTFGTFTGPVRSQRGRCSTGTNDTRSQTSEVDRNSAHDVLRCRQVNATDGMQGASVSVLMRSSWM